MSEPDLAALMAKMFGLLAGTMADVDGAILDIYNDVVKIMPTGQVAGLRAICTAELHERGEDT